MKCSKGFDSNFWKCKGKCPCPKPDWRPIPEPEEFLKPHILVDPKPDWRPIPNDKFLKPHILIDPKPDWRPIPEESLRKQIVKDFEYDYKEGPIKDYIEYDYIKKGPKLKITESDKSDIMLAKQALKNFDKFRGFCENKKWHPTKSLCKPLG